MGETPFIKFYPSDFLGGTSGLSPAERGCYVTLLCLIYEADGPIERDDTRLSRRCGAPKAAFTRILEALIAEGKITETDGMLSNNRAEKAIVDRTNRTQSGTHAANQRWTAQAEKSQQKQRPNDATAMRGQCAEVCQPEPEPELDIRKRDTNVSLVQNVPDRFDEFWQRYPRKIGKGAAHKAYAKATRKADHDDLMFGLSQQLPAMQAKDQQYIPHAATWLNAERWSDEPEQPDSNARRNTGTHTTIDAIAIAGRAHRTPTEDCF